MLIIAIMLILIFMLSTGFFIPIYETPNIFQTLSYVNFFKIHLQSVILILFKGRCESTPILYNSYGINESQLNSNLFHLLIEAIILRLIGLIIMLFQTHDTLIFSFLRRKFKIFKSFIEIKELEESVSR